MHRRCCQQAGQAEQRREAPGGALDGGEIDQPPGPGEGERAHHRVRRSGRAKRPIREVERRAEVGSEERDVIGLAEGRERQEHWRRRSGRGGGGGRRWGA